MKKLLRKDRERNIYLVKEFTTENGKKAFVTETEWAHPIITLPNHFCGYVEKSKDDTKKYYDDNEINVHGGVTFEGELLDTKDIFVGFDMAHLGDNDIGNPLEYAVSECESLAKQMK